VLEGRKALRVRGVPERYAADIPERMTRKQLAKYVKTGDISFDDYPWDMNFYCCQIFLMDRFYFIPYRWGGAPDAWRSLKTGEVKALWTGGVRVRRDGQLDGVNGVVQENITGARVVKAYTREEYECGRFGVANDALCAVNLRVMRLMALIQPMLTIVLNFSVIAVVYLGGASLASGIGGMTTGTVMAGVTFITQVVSSLMMVGMMFNSVSRAAASAKRVREVLGSEPIIVSGDRTEG
jgi:ABC-type multidrug transport system fused ATPase/permease subunit